MSPDPKSPQSLSDLQLAVMREIWSRGEATVAEVHTALQRERGLAMTTIATVLSRLEKQGLLAHRREGRLFVYRALISEADVKNATVQDIRERLFHGDVAELVSHLLSESEVSEGDLARVKDLIERREREIDPPPHGSPGE